MNEYKMVIAMLEHEDTYEDDWPEQKEPSIREMTAAYESLTLGKLIYRRLMLYAAAGRIHRSDKHQRRSVRNRILAVEIVIDKRRNSK